MSRYINRDETVKALIELDAKLGSQQQAKRGVRLAIGYVNNLPTIDMVHCKDCKHSRVYALDSNEEPQRWCVVGIVKAVDDDDYCSWGE